MLTQHLFQLCKLKTGSHSGPPEEGPRSAPRFRAQRTEGHSRTRVLHKKVTWRQRSPIQIRWCPHAEQTSAVEACWGEWRRQWQRQWQRQWFRFRFRLRCPRQNVAEHFGTRLFRRFLIQISTITYSSFSQWLFSLRKDGTAPSLAKVFCNPRLSPSWMRFNAVFEVSK